MGKSYRLVVFDWEGTLGDTLGQIINILKTEASRIGITQPNEEIARKYLIYGISVAVRKLYPNIELEKQEELLQAVQYSLGFRSTEVYLLPGARDLLQRLHQAGVELAIASNKSQNSLARVLTNAGLEDLFTVTRTASQAPAKPCGQMLQEIMDFCDIKANQTVVIGDSVTDIEMAAALNVDAIGVDFYDQENQRKALKEAGALEVFTDFQALANYLNLS